MQWLLVYLIAGGITVETEFLYPGDRLGSCLDHQRAMNTMFEKSTRDYDCKQVPADYKPTPLDRSVDFQIEVVNRGRV